MATNADQAILLAQANERLRQEAAAFDESMRQYRLWMRVRRAMLWVGTALLPSIMAASVLILIFHERFATGTVTAAAAALFVDSLGVVGAIWKSVAGLAPPEAPRPISNEPFRLESNANSLVRAQVDDH